MMMIKIIFNSIILNILFIMCFLQNTRSWKLYIYYSYNVCYSYFNFCTPNPIMRYMPPALRHDYISFTSLCSLSINLYNIELHLVFYCYCICVSIIIIITMTIIITPIRPISSLPDAYLTFLKTDSGHVSLTGDLNVFKYPICLPFAD
jgi:hypothetical protein